MDLMKIQIDGAINKLANAGGILKLQYTLITNKVILIINKLTGVNYLMVQLLMFMNGHVVVCYQRNGLT